MLKLVSRISPKIVCGTVSPVFTNDANGKPEIIDGKERVLFTIIGIARNYAVKQTNFGESIAFKGQFKAINEETKEEFISGVCYLPPSASEALLGALMGAMENAGSVDFAFKIGIQNDNSSVTKYVYTIAPLLETAASDPLELLSARVMGIAALPAPEEKKEEAPPTAAKPKK